MKLATCNIKNFPDMQPAQVAQDARTLALHATLAGLQEIQPREDTKVVMDGLHSIGRSFWMVGRDREDPVVGRADRWHLLDHNVVRFNRPKLPRPASANGGVVSVIVQSIKRPHLLPFALVNVHLVAGGYNGPRLPEVARRWDVEWAITRQEVMRLHKKRLTVYLVGDLNNPHPSKPASRLRWLTPERGAPDHIGELVSRHSVRLDRPRYTLVGLNSDHDLHVVSGPIRRAGDR